ncbi:hypothetical protein [Actinomyces oris]|uniref:hypothetical protein n=1 Tax=Actinomyces oris TaxID=544580 RepID=UPI000B25E91C|nr:hypothetical protein [Actinomyces oris]
MSAARHASVPRRAVQLLELTVVVIHSFTQICFNLKGTIVLALVLTGFQLSLGVVALGAIIMGFFIGAVVNFFNNSISNHLVGISGDIFDQTEVVDSIVSNDVHVTVARDGDV